MKVTLKTVSGANFGIEVELTDTVWISWLRECCVLKREVVVGWEEGMCCDPVLGTALHEFIHV